MKRKSRYREALNAAMGKYAGLPEYKINRHKIPELEEWLKQRGITEYTIVELYSFILFYNEKDAIIFSIGYKL